MIRLLRRSCGTGFANLFGGTMYPSCYSSTLMLLDHSLEGIFASYHNFVANIYDQCIRIILDHFIYQP
jgi:hypothetical protein